MQTGPIYMQLGLICKLWSEKDHWDTHKEHNQTLRYLAVPDGGVPYLAVQWVRQEREAWSEGKTEWWGRETRPSPRHRVWSNERDWLPGVVVVGYEVESDGGEREGEREGER